MTDWVSETMVIAKDRIINDLRIQVPTTVDRAIAVASISGHGDLALPLTEDFEAKRGLSVAQSTITSLRERLEQKEETLKRYEKLMKEARDENETELRQKQDEIVALQKSLKTQTTALNDLKRMMSSTVIAEGSRSTSEVIGQQSQRIQELEDEIKELQASIAELTTQLASLRSEADKNLRAAKSRQKEIDELRENEAIQRQMNRHEGKEEAERLKSMVKRLKEENELLQQDMASLRDANARAPSSIMKALVEKLRSDLAEKEKKMKAMAKAIAELKKQLIAQAEQQSHQSSRAMTRLRAASPQSDSVQVKAIRQNLEEVININSKLDRRIKTHEENELALQKEIRTLKDELSQKGTVIVKLKEQKSRDLSGQDGDDGETQELRETIRRLRQQLEDLNQAEKPLEAGGDHSKALKNAVEVARWEERKKLEAKLETMRKRLNEANEDVSKMSKTNQGLREMVNRLEREKVILDNRAKAAQRASTGKTKVFGGRLEEVQRENNDLKEQVARLKHEQLMGGEDGTEALRLRNRMLMERLTNQEKKISALELCKEVGGASGLLEEVKKWQSKEKEWNQKIKSLENEAIQLRYNQVKLSKITEAVQSLKVILDRSDLNDDIRSEVERASSALTNVQGLDGQGTPQKRSPVKTTKEAKTLLAEVQKLKNMNVSLVAKIEDRDKRINDLEQQIRSKMGPTKSIPITTVSQATPPSASIISPDRLRDLEADLKRKSDLLTEVKVLLKTAAEREKAQVADNERLKEQIKLILQVDPKSPSEILAKELRQSRLTVERLECEKRELEHKLAVGVC